MERNYDLGGSSKSSWDKRDGSARPSWDKRDGSARPSWDKRGGSGKPAWDNLTSKGRDEKLLDDDFNDADRTIGRVQKGCWSSFSSCFGGMWATRQMATQEEREVYVKTTLRELVIYLIFLGNLCVITFAITTFYGYYYTRALNEVIVDTPYEDTRNNLRGSTQVLDFWRFIEQVLIDGIYWENWYNLELNKTKMEDRNVLYENRLLGVPRMRQLRVRNDSCTVPAFFQRQISKCFAPYNEKHEDKQPFGLKTYPTWTYQTAHETKSIGTWGKLATYSGAGYYLDFKTTKNETRLQMNQLRENLWIDRGTRVVFIDFTVYNANINLFCIVKIIVEFPPTGGIIPSWSFRTVKMIRYLTSLDYFVMACEIVFVFFVTYYVVEETLEIVSLKEIYFKSIWNILDLLVIVLSLVCIIFNICNYMTVEPRLKYLLKYPESYANLEDMGYWQVQFNSVVAVCVFFSWFKLFKYISFNKTMTQLSSTLSRCAKDVAGFAIMFFIVFFAFSQLGLLIFGPQVYDFHTFIDSVFTLLRTILGDFNFREIEEANRIVGPIFFLSYVFFVFFVLLNMFLAIINDTYTEVKTEIATQRNEFEIADYFKRGYNNMMSKIGKRDKIIDIENALKLEAEKHKDGQLTYDEVRRCLKDCNYSENEIELFFAKYDKGDNKVLTDEEVKFMLRDLADQNQHAEPINFEVQRPASARPSHPQQGPDSLLSSSLSNNELLVLNSRVERMESGVENIAAKIDGVFYKIDHLEKTRLKKKEALEKLLDDITYDDGK